ncbi:hypothetical protein GQ457_12G016080 [Hibiscus cannabinus]
MHKSESSCEEAVLGLHHMRQKNQLHFKECMIQRLCENSMVRLPNTGSNMAELKKIERRKTRTCRRLKDHVFRDTHTQSHVFYASNDQPGIMNCSSIVKLY